MKSIVGLDHPERTASTQLMGKFLAALRTSYKNLCLDQALKLQLSPRNPEPRDALVCPISKEVMVDPVVCTLDGYTYEREQITEWLGEHRNSPMNRSEMEDWQEIDHVLAPNRAIKELIDQYNDQNLSRNQVVYEEESSVRRTPK